MQFATNELTAYAAAIVMERGITENQMTPALMGEILTEALARMDKLVMEVTEARTYRAREFFRPFSAAVYVETVSRQAAL